MPGIKVCGLYYCQAFAFCKNGIGDMDHGGVKDKRVAQET